MIQTVGQSLSYLRSVSPMADGGIWPKAKIPPHKYGIVAFGATITGLSSQIAMAVGKKSAMPFQHGIPI